MMYSHHKYTILLFSLALLFSCARKGSPSGGPKDITPPILLSANPDTLQTNVSTQLEKITLNFDEYIVLKDFNKNFLISPPVDPSPIVTPQGIASKKLEIIFESDLKPGTTYTLNFGQGIQDNNEGNKLPYFSYVFSTGDKIDSLYVQGKINNPLSKEKTENLIAALYPIDSAYTDSIIYKQKPYYVAKVDSAMNFQLKNLKEGSYKLIAFNDAIPNLQFDAKSELLAFYPNPINPIQNQTYDLTLYKPEVPFRNIEATQLEQGKLAFYFEGKPKNPEIIPISHKINSGRTIHKAYSDTLIYYFNPTASGDSLMDKRPRLKFVVRNNGVSDTISPILYDKEKVTPLKIYVRSQNYVPGKNIQIESNYPLDTLQKDYIAVKSDSLDMNFDIERLDYNRFGLNFPIQFEKNYNITLYPSAVTDMMSRTNDTVQYNLSVKTERDYGNLFLQIKNKPNVPAWLKLLNSNQKEIQSIYTEQDSFEFKHLVPGEYSFELILDENANQRFDTGNIFENRQAEKIYIYPETITVKAFWDLQETWVLEQRNDSKSSEDNKTPKATIPKDVMIQKPK